jgi:hypothetical protein
MDEHTAATETPRDREERRRNVRRVLLGGVVVSSLGLTVACGAVGSDNATGTTAGTTGTASSSGSSSTSAWSTGSGVSPAGGSTHATSSGS